MSMGVSPEEIADRRHADEFDSRSVQCEQDGDRVVVPLYAGISTRECSGLHTYGVTV